MGSTVIQVLVLADAIDELVDANDWEAMPTADQLIKSGNGRSSGRSASTEDSGKPPKAWA